MKTLTPAVAVLTLLYACGGQTLDVGSNMSMGGAGGSSTAVPSSVGGGGGCPGQRPYYAPGGSGPVATPPLPEWPAPSCLTEPTPVQGTWTGHILGNSHPLADFTLSLEAGGSVPCGTLVFDELQSFPVATDAEAPAPGLPAGIMIVPGFAYTPLEPTIMGDRIQFRISYAEPWRSWCKLQSSYCDEFYGGYYCSDAVNLSLLADGRCTGTDSKGKALGTLSCAQASTCRDNIGGPPSGYEICACDVSGCDANQSAEGRSFDFLVVGDTAQGVVDNAAAYLARN
jgi:hypothetical protein